MRIAFSGAAGTGKTTLAKLIAEKYNLPMIPEGVREYLAINGKGLRNMTPSDTMAMQLQILNDKLAAEENMLSFISDRTTADSLAYTLRWCSRDIADDTLEDYTRRCIQHLSAYDIVFFCPWGVIEYEMDGLRSSHIYYQLGMECMIYGILMRSQVMVHWLTSTALEDRVREVSEIMKRVRRYS